MKTIVFLACTGALFVLGCGDKLDPVGPDEADDTAADAGAEAAYSTTILPVKPILDTYCVSCHSTRGATAGVALDTYENAAANAERGNALMQSGEMPPSGPAPSAEEKQLFETWVNTGLTE